MLLTQDAARALREAVDSNAGMLPAAYRESFRRHVRQNVAVLKVAQPTQPPPTTAPAQPAVTRPSASPAASEALEDLRDTLLTFFDKYPSLQRMPQVAAFVDKVVGAMSPLVSGAMGGQESLEGQLAGVPDVGREPVKPESAAQMLQRDLTGVPEEPTRDVAMPTDFNPPSPVPQVPQKPLVRRRASGDFDGLTARLVEAADAADDEGLTKVADGLTALLPKLRMMRAAQYEGFVNYWIANSRAFERAWKEKRLTKKLHDNLPRTNDDYRSFQECWFEVLDEYQKGLLGNHREFLGKYASKEEERADMGGSTPIMSGRMTEFAQDMEARAKKEGKTIGQIYSEWLDSHKAACDYLVRKASDRAKAGEQPGVAFYETMDEILAGGPGVELASEAIGILDEATKQASTAGAKVTVELVEKARREAQSLSDWWANISSLGKEMLGVGPGTGASFQHGPSLHYLQQIQERWPEVNSEIQARVGRGGYGRMGLTRLLTPLLTPLRKYVQRMQQAGYGEEVRVPSARSFFSGTRGAMAPEKMNEYLGQLKQIIRTYVNPKIAKDVDDQLGRWLRKEPRKPYAPRQQKEAPSAPTAPAQAPVAAPAPAPLGPAQTQPRPSVATPQAPALSFQNKNLLMRSILRNIGTLGEDAKAQAFLGDVSSLLTQRSAGNSKQWKIAQEEWKQMPTLALTPADEVRDFLQAMLAKHGLKSDEFVNTVSREMEGALAPEQKGFQPEQQPLAQPQAQPQQPAQQPTVPSPAAPVATAPAKPQRTPGETTVALPPVAPAAPTGRGVRRPSRGLKGFGPGSFG